MIKVNEINKYFDQTEQSIYFKLNKLIKFSVLGNLQHQPLKVAPLANDRCVVLCGRELRVYDINTGGELLKLKGNNDHLNN